MENKQIVPSSSLIFCNNQYCHENQQKAVAMSWVYPLNESSLFDVLFFNIAWMWANETAKVKLQIILSVEYCNRCFGISFCGNYMQQILGYQRVISSAPRPPLPLKISSPKESKNKQIAKNVYMTWLVIATSKIL